MNVRGLIYFCIDLNEQIFFDSSQRMVNEKYEFTYEVMQHSVADFLVFVFLILQ